MIIKFLCFYIFHAGWRTIECYRSFTTFYKCNIFPMDESETSSMLLACAKTLCSHVINFIMPQCFSAKSVRITGALA